MNEEIKNLYHKYLKIESELNLSRFPGYTKEERKTIKKKFKKTKTKITTLIEELIQNESNNIYHDGSGFELYKEYYQMNFNKYREERKHSKEIHFLESEIDKCDSLYHYWKFIYPDSKAEDYIFSLNERKKYLESKIIAIENNNDKEQKETPKNYEEKIWFKIGLLFAQGIIQDMYKETINHAEVSRKVNEEYSQNFIDFSNKSLRPYITDTNTGRKTDKDIYSKLDKMKFIREYCIKKDINICTDFQEKYDELVKKDESK